MDSTGCGILSSFSKEVILAILPAPWSRAVAAPY
jgi:hypothetical protein